jgi:peptidoglycan/LPS O-acetylase OafA/YrhL
MTSDRAGGRHVAALDGMRGIAVLLVMLTHAIYGAPYLQGGSIGVDIFFVLSGFLITYLLVREHDRHGHRISLWKFYARRALRLGPALALLLVVLALGGCLFFDPETARSNLIDVAITVVYAVNWARAFDIHPPQLLGHAWSLSIEEQFYLLWPLILIVMLRAISSRRRIATAILLGAVVSYLWRVALALQGASVQRLYNGLDTRADSLLVGCALGLVLGSNLIREESRPVIAAKLKLVAPMTAVAIAVTVLFSSWKAAHVYYWLLGVIEVLVGLTILQLLVCNRCLVKSCLSIKPLVWIGTISYGLYLWHYPIYSVLHGRGMTFKGILAGTVLSVAIASLSYYGLERPILRLKERLAREALTSSGATG